MLANLEDCINNLDDLAWSSSAGPASDLWQSTLEHVLLSLHRYKPSDSESLVSTRHIVDKLDEVRLTSH
jgi:hypothetical protein